MKTRKEIEEQIKIMKENYKEGLFNKQWIEGTIDALKWVIEQ